MAAVYRLSLLVSVVAAVLVFATMNDTFSMAKYADERSEFISRLRSMSLGADLPLSSSEEIANGILMGHKYEELDQAYNDVSKFNPAQHFFKMKRLIDKSPVFNIIKRMPKGAVLHAHDTALLGPEFLLKLTYMENLYACISDDGKMKLHFYKTPPISKHCKWRLMSDLRQSAEDVKEFDRKLSERFTLVVDEPEHEYRDMEVAWNKFESIFMLITPMLTYKPVWKLYFYEALRQFREDGVFYLELRSTLPNLYDLEGNTYGPVECARAYKEVTDEFKIDYPDSFGSRLIYAPHRSVTFDQIKAYVKTCFQLKKEFGDFFLGFDLVGQEDKGWSLENIASELFALKNHMEVFYHVGETNWYGSNVDGNMYDAVQLGAKRLGHAFALVKHPHLAKIVAERGIAVEVSPISNQVLRLVEDMRNHPAAIMIANNYPMVIASDDPGLWGASPLSYDLYETFIGIASRESDIRLIKKLALNSIEYSCMPQEEKQKATIQFLKLWSDFVKHLVKEHDNSNKNSVE